MSWPFACCIAAVVTGTAVGNDIRMIKGRGRPSRSRMTIVTVVVAADMRGMLAGCRYAIVTRAAAADYLSVVDSNNRRPKIDRVTIFANI